MTEEIHGFDCAWLIAGKNPSFQNALTAFLDWKLSGQISKVLAEKRKIPTIVPTMGRVEVPYIVVDPSEEPDWDVIKHKCEGTQWMRLLLIMEKGPKPHTPKSFFEKVVVSTP